MKIAWVQIYRRPPTDQSIEAVLPNHPRFAKSEGDASLICMIEKQNMRDGWIQAIRDLFPPE